MRLLLGLRRSSILVLITLLLALIGSVVYLRATRVMVRAGVWTPRQVRMVVFQPCACWGLNNAVYSPYPVYRTTDKKAIRMLYRAANKGAFGASLEEDGNSRLAFIRRDGRMVMFALEASHYDEKVRRLVLSDRADAVTQSAFRDAKPDRTRISALSPSSVSLQDMTDSATIQLALSEPEAREQFNAILGRILDRFNPYSLGGSWRGSSGQLKGVSGILSFMERKARSTAYAQVELTEPIRFNTVIIPWGMRWPAPYPGAEGRCKLSPVVADTLLIISSQERHYRLPVLYLAFGSENGNNWVVSAPLLSNKPRPKGAPAAPGVAGDLFSDLESLIRRHPMQASRGDR